MNFKVQKNWANTGWISSSVSFPQYFQRFIWTFGVVRNYFFWEDIWKSHTHVCKKVEIIPVHLLLEFLEDSFLTLLCFEAVYQDRQKRPKCFTKLFIKRIWRFSERNHFFRELLKVSQWLFSLSWLSFAQSRSQSPRAFWSAPRHGALE